jgi:hypothetical protein
MKDDAVAPVIAVMLILAAAVTFLTVWNGIYIPSMKQSAEVGHLQNVESAFLHFSSDIERAVSARQNLTLSEPVPLGGGDFFFNTLRSSGSISVQDEHKPVYYLTLDDETNEDKIINGTLVNISYNPVGNFWQDQGYRWQYGYLNVTKYRIKQTPLGYDTMTDVSNGFEGSGSLAIFAGSLAGADYTLNQTPLQNASPTTDNRFTFSPQPDTCSGIVIRAVTFSVSPDHPFISGNGFGTLELASTVTSVPYYGVQKISIGSGGEPFGNATFRNWNSSFTTLAGACKNNIEPGDSYDGFNSYTVLQKVSPVNVTLNIINIEVGVY